MILIIILIYQNIIVNNFGFLIHFFTAKQVKSRYYKNMSKFDMICKYGVCGDIKQFYFDNELVDYLKQYGDDISNYDFKITHHGIKYVPHWLFFNTKFDSALYGILYRSINNDGDVLFGVVGCKLDTINNGIMSFESLYNLLTDKYYYID